MKKRNGKPLSLFFGAGASFLATSSLVMVSVAMADPRPNPHPCKDLPAYGRLKAALQAVVDGGSNGGLGNDMWVTVVNRMALSAPLLRREMTEEINGRAVVSSQLKKRIRRMHLVVRTESSDLLERCPPLTFMPLFNREAVYLDCNIATPSTLERRTKATLKITVGPTILWSARRLAE